MGKIVQTAGRNTLGEFAPEFAHFNDDVLFGENWNNQDIDVKTRSIITVVALMASGITDSSLKYHLQNAKNHGVTHMPHSMQVGQKHGLFSILQRKCGKQAKEICHTKRKRCGRMQKRWYFQLVHQMMALHSIFLAEVFLHRFPLLRLAFST